MREIKFRAWDKRHEKMFFGDKDGWSWFSDVYMPKPLSNEAFLMQYTGLKDKNGKEIYESDLVKFQGNLYEVQFVAGKYQIVAGWYENELPDGNMDYSISNQCEIVGNIYQNPELLK